MSLPCVSCLGGLHLIYGWRKLTFFLPLYMNMQKWHDPLRNRRQSFLEESYLGVFTQLNDYRILNAGCCGAWSSLPAVFLSCIYNFKIGIKTQKLFEMTWACAVVQSQFSISLACLSAHVFCAQLLYEMQMQRNFRISLFHLENPWIPNWAFIYLFIIIFLSVHGFSALSKSFLNELRGQLPGTSALSLAEFDLLY